MKNFTAYIFTISCLFLVQQTSAQELQRMYDIYFQPSQYNSAYIVDQNNDKPVYIAMSTSLSGGVQDMRRVNFLATTKHKKLDINLGLRANTSFYGIFNNTIVETIYGQEFKVTPEYRIHAGVHVGVNYIGMDQSKLNNHVNYEDPFLLDNNFPIYRLTAGIGIAYLMKDKFEFGASIPSLIKTRNDFRPDFIINGKYKTDLGQYFRIEPEVLLYGYRSPLTTAEFNATVYYLEWFGSKVGVRTNGSMLFGISWNRETIQVGYIYHINMGKFYIINPGTHNVSVSHQF